MVLRLQAVLQGALINFLVPRLMLPYCLQIGASETEEVFTSFSGSASCPLGSAISGWYNLPAVPVKAGDLGGPQNFTGLQLFLDKFEAKELSHIVWVKSLRIMKCSLGYQIPSTYTLVHKMKLGKGSLCSLNPAKNKHICHLGRPPLSTELYPPYFCHRYSMKPVQC